MAVKVLRYFDSYAQQELSTGVRPTLTIADPTLLEGPGPGSSGGGKMLLAATCAARQ